MMHRVALSFEDGVTRFITCDEGQTVADASYRQRINIPVDCNDGACGTCKALCESGEFEAGTYLEDALAPDEAAEGYCLPCQVRPRGDLVLRIAATSEVARTRAASYTATVTEIVRHSPTTVALTIELPDRDELTFLPGQYVNIEVPGTDAVRSYSFSTAPSDRELSFLVKVVEGGAMSTWLNQRARVGDPLTFTGPHGSFFLRESHRPALLVAGGTGLAPILSMLRQAAHVGTSRTFHVVYGVNTDADVVELDTLRSLQRRLPNLTWDYCVADPASSAAHKGFVMSIIDDTHLHGGDATVYLCGPPPMVDAVRSDVAERGIVPAGFFYEKFSSAGQLAARSSDPDAGSPAPVAAAAPAAPAAAGRPVVHEPARALEDVPDWFAAPDAVPAAAAYAVVGDDPGGMRGIGGQEVFARSTVAPAHDRPRPLLTTDGPATVRSLAGQLVFAGRPTGKVTPLDAVATALVENHEARGVAGQLTFARRVATPATPLPPTGVSDLATAPDGYEIGEEHRSIADSDAIFEAREALELGALELVIGRLDSQQVAGYRLLAHSTVPHVRGDRFVDAASFTEANGAFHDYLFTQTGNEHLRRAYKRLGVTAHMDNILSGATWCHPMVTKDHLDIVDAVEAGDRVRARELIHAHALRSKDTMRRAMKDRERRTRPAAFSPGRFADKVVLVTGAAQGIGEAVARRIHAEGGTLVLADRSPIVGDLATELAAQPGRPPIANQADLETYDGAQAVVDTALQRFGRIDVAIHNVGGAIWFKPFEEFTPEQIDAEVSRSLMTTLYGCRAVLSPMLAAGGGTIVNISSIATGGIHRVPYAAAKGGVNAITRALAVEAAPRGVRVLATAPGGTEAPPRRIARGPAPVGVQEQQWYQAHIDQTLDSSLMGRYGTLDEQAAVVCFLASDEAAYMTGTVVPVGGGDLG